MKLTVVIVNKYGNEIALVHRNEFEPYKFRTVQIELTEEQIAKIEPRHLGEHRTGGQSFDVFEEIYNSWLEE